MGYAICIGTCLCCKRQMSFNPVRVPSLKGEPICQDCIDLANEQREKMGLPPHKVHPDAYGPCDEHELG